MNARRAAAVAARRAARIPRSADAMSGSTTSGNGGQRPHGSREQHAPQLRGELPSRRAKKVALFVRPPFFPAFGVVVGNVFHAHLFVFVDEGAPCCPLLFRRLRHKGVAFGNERAVRFRMAAPAKRDEVARRIIPAAGTLDDMMDLQPPRIVAERAAVAVALVYALARLVRYGSIHGAFGLHSETPFRLIRAQQHACQGWPTAIFEALDWRVIHRLFHKRKGVSL